MASRSSSEFELPDCPSQPTSINFPKRKRRMFTALFRAVGSNCENGYTMLTDKEKKLPQQKLLNETL